VAATRDRQADAGTDDEPRPLSRAHTSRAQFIGGASRHHSTGAATRPLAQRTPPLPRSTLACEIGVGPICAPCRRTAG
jgi:hypothetical protein